MLELAEKIIEVGLHTHAITETELYLLLGGTDASRYGIVNKALKKGLLIRLKRGIYILNVKQFPTVFSQFYLASQTVTHSYISFESALAYHGWIPERIVEISSVIAQGRTRGFNTQKGRYTYQNIPTNKYEFLTMVTRKEINGQSFLIATPLRALADLVYSKKIDWQGIDLLTDGYRIDMDELQTITSNDIKKVMSIYHSKRVINFLKKLEKELKIHAK